ncbi:MAG: DUF4352 domain-containing protein [bacterium]|nr:DUF4352 domain-containing protein [bacterium]
MPNVWIRSAAWVLVAVVVAVAWYLFSLSEGSRQQPTSEQPTSATQVAPAVTSPEARYDAARAAIADENWAEARAHLDALPSNYRDVASLKVQVRNAESRYWYNEAMKVKAKKDYSLAFQLLKQAKEAGGNLPADAEREMRFLRPLAAQQEAREAKSAPAERKRAEAQARREETNAILREMHYYTSGRVGIAVGEVRFRSSLGEHNTSGNWTFVLVSVSVRNSELASEHVNPNNFTLSTPDGYTVSHDTGTYSLNYLGAVNLQRGQSTSGWIAFALPKANWYTLNYQSFNVSASKKITLGKGH